MAQKDSLLSAIVTCQDLLYDLQRLSPLLDAYEEALHHGKPEKKLDAIHLFISLYREKSESIVLEIEEELQMAVDSTLQ